MHFLNFVLLNIVDLNHLRPVQQFFWKYRWRFFLGILFILLSNYFRILSPQMTGFVMDKVQLALYGEKNAAKVAAFSHEMFIKEARFDPLVYRITHWISLHMQSLNSQVLVCGITILFLALLGGFFMFLMRQSIIVMSRHIEFDQKNVIFNHYLRLDLMFYKMQRTGDLMNRISEDVSRVRMYTGPALMYFINLAATIGLSVYFMVRTQPMLTLYVLAPLPILAFTIYKVNMWIHHKSEQIQGQLSSLTTHAQESYSGIRVIKSFVQEKAMQLFFKQNSIAYRENAIDLSKMESMYFPTMGFLIGLSTLLTIMMGGVYAIRGNEGITVGTITEFVMYVNMLTFPVSAIGWTASMIQRASASQKRINEFMDLKPDIVDMPNAANHQISGKISFSDINYTYPNTGIHALKQFSLTIEPGQKVAIVGHTGSGKTTLAQLLLRFMDPQSGSICIDDKPIESIRLEDLRSQISYVPQDVFLFSDTIRENISFGMRSVSEEAIQKASKAACVDTEILKFDKGYDTVIGERGVTLSGGQKQRVSIARCLIKEPKVVVFDDCLSAIDAITERNILQNLHVYLDGRTAILITHRIFSLMDFDNIIVLEEGRIIESGTHEALLRQNGKYAALYEQQRNQPSNGDGVAS